MKSIQEVRSQLRNFHHGCGEQGPEGGPGREQPLSSSTEQKQQGQAGLGRNRAAETARVEDDHSLGPSGRADEDIPETVKDAEADKAATGHAAHNVPDKTHPGPHIG